MSDNTPGAREDLLRELVLRLSTYPGDPHYDNPQLLVGQLPDNLAIPVPMPEKSQVIGTFQDHPPGLTGHFRTKIRKTGMVYSAS